MILEWVIFILVTKERWTLVKIDRHESIPKRDIILKWVYAFQVTESVIKLKSPRLTRNVHRYYGKHIE